jgi:nitrite reductase (NADH) large subunit
MNSGWERICNVQDIEPDSGVCAIIAGRQIAVFRVDDSLFALDNYDPASNAQVLSRGIVGDLGGELVVASPVYKQHFSLTTGRCVEDPSLSVAVHPVRSIDGGVWLPAAAARRANTRQRLVVIGNGMAALRTLDELLRLAPDVYDITVFGAESHSGYNRILLSSVLSGEKQPGDIVSHSAQWYSEQGIALHLIDPVVAIDRQRRQVRAASGRVCQYDRLLIATGSIPNILDIPGVGLPGVVTFRSLADVASMLAAAQPAKPAVVIGGGLLGLEAAAGLARRGMQVTVLHSGDHLLDRQLDPAAAQFLQQALSARGIEFRLAANTTAIRGELRADSVVLSSDENLPATLVVIAAGVSPSIELARNAGLYCGRGIVVDDTMQTFDPSIYAVGECVQHRAVTFGLVAPLWDQARVCAQHLANIGVTRYHSRVHPVQLKVTGIDLVSAGDFMGGPGRETLVMRDPQRGVYRKIVLDGAFIRGVLLYGDSHDAAWYLQAIEKRLDVSAWRDTLLFGAPATESAAA